METKNRKRKTELLAPAGTMECFRAALAAGADAVYLGGQQFGARAFAGNFSQEELLEALHIQPAWLERYPAELSGGELQRFCIARALRPGVQYLLCDEITAMLDLITQAQIWTFLLEQVERRDLGLVIVSHNTPLLERLCTRIQDLDK